MPDHFLNPIVHALAAAVERRDAITAAHQRRVAELATAIAHEIGLSKERIEDLFVAATLHDAGKIDVPPEILNKPSKLTPLEYQLLQIHPQTGYDIVKSINLPWRIAQIILQHHERLDGSGYPRRLEGHAILPEAKILAVADVVDAIMSHRPYHSARGVEAGLAEIEKDERSRYDAEAVEACAHLLRNKGFTG